MGKNNDFGNIGNEFINIYSEENPILNINDVCYFMMTNIHDYHRPLVCKGLIINDRFSDGMNKEYFIQLLEVVESPNIINKFVVGKTFPLYPVTDNNGTVGVRRNVQINSGFNFQKYSFKITAFFVRNNLEKITNLRAEYISIIRKDIINQLQDIDGI